MKKKPNPLTKKQSLAKMADALGFIPRSERELLQVAADGLVWRNARITQLETMVIRRGGWPWSAQ